ncbi:MAG: pitrilysin family protein [Saprospiraceae bacterium]
MQNRKQAPPIVPIQDVPMPSYATSKLANGVTIYDIRSGSQEILRLELVFPGGRWKERKPLVSKAAAALWKDGTTLHTSAELAQNIDYYGASINTFSNPDFDVIVLYCLKKHYRPLLDILLEILQFPSFPDSELQTFVANNKQRLKVDLAKNDVIAFREFTEAIYGSKHPYGYNSSEEHYDALLQQDLVDHYQRIYQPSNLKVFISGDTDDELIGLTAQSFGSIREGNKAKGPKLNFAKPQGNPGKIILQGMQDMQVSVAMGRRMVKRSHKDYAGLYVLNTVLGGYFSSRLMTNIREKKGYTYNIYSHLEPLLNDGYFYISTDISKAFLKDTLHQINREIKLLQEEEIGQEEMHMLKNYLAGNFLSAIDGPMNIGELVKMIETESLPVYYLPMIAKEVRELSSKRLMQLAKKYLDPSTFTLVIVQ